jgi:putative copper export protein
MSPYGNASIYSQKTCCNANHIESFFAMFIFIEKTNIFMYDLTLGLINLYCLKERIWKSQKSSSLLAVIATSL